MKKNRTSKITSLVVLAAILIIITMIFMAYIISPIDFLPVFATGFAGVVDDMIALLGAFGTAAGAVTSLVFAIKGESKQAVVIAD